MEANIHGSPSFAYLDIELAPGESVIAESDAMATMAAGLEMRAQLNGGLFSGLCKKLLGKESLFISEFTAKKGPGEIGIASGSTGDIEHVYLDSETIYLQNSGYVASSPGVELNTKWQGLMKGFFSGEGLFLIKCSGKGDLFFSVEGLVTRFHDRGRLWIQTRQVPSFATWIRPFRRVQKSNK